MTGLPERAPANAVNRHCCVVEVDGTGVMLTGDAGSGKTSLALGLIEQAKLQGLDAHFVADDQALVWAEGGRLMAQVPEPIAGKVEIRGFGIDTIAFKSATAIGLAGALVADDRIDRMPEARSIRLLGVEIPELLLPERHEAGAARIVLGHLRANARTRPD